MSNATRTALASGDTSCRHGSHGTSDVGAVTPALDIPRVVDEWTARLLNRSPATNRPPARLVLDRRSLTKSQAFG